jgi:hypothetical protein
METQEIQGNIKEALYEFFCEHSDLLKNTVREVLEDIALGRAMEEADKGDYVDEYLVIESLKSSS